MNAQVIDNSNQFMSEVLTSEIEKSSDIRVAVAFMSRGGFAIIQPGIELALENNAQIEFLVGLDMYSTEPEAIKSLFEISNKNRSVNLYCMSKLDSASIYHPKMYLFKSDPNVTVIVGSSNLTNGGLRENIEVNISIKASVDDELVSSLYGTYNRLKFHPKRVIPDEEFIYLYAELYEIQKRHENVKKRNQVIQKALKDFNTKAASLQHPKPTKGDLVGWLEMIYDALPDTEFTTRDIYKHEDYFNNRFPRNRNIRAKIRQQLQVLRDIGLIDHIGSARWKKK